MSKIKFIIAVGLVFLAVFYFSQAAEKKVDYRGTEIIDSDLDGLTNEGEKQIFKTDPMDPDTDGDGILDGAEVISQTDPLDNTSPRVVETITNNAYMVQKEVPWAWYFTRASALLAYALLYLSIFLGVSIRIPWLNRLVRPIYSYSVHCWISLQALVFVMAHGVFILADNFMNFKLVNIIIPFYPIVENQMPGISPEFLALGIVGFYLIVILVVTSYLKKVISHTLWRGLHFLNIGLFAIVFIHALYIGTDLKIGITRDIFVYANAFLVFLFLINIFVRIFKALTKKEASPINETNSLNNENIRQSPPAVVQKRSTEAFRRRI